MSWGGLYGGAWGTSNQALAKEDTRLLLIGSTTTDDSQYAIDLTATGSAGYETGSDRGAITGATGREIYVRCTLAAAEADVILAAHAASDASAVTWAIGTTGLGALMLYQGAGVIWTGPSAPAADVSISWSTRPNPDTTGASDALISEVIVYDHDAEEYLVLEQVTHAVPSTSSAYTLTVGGLWTGVLVSAPTNPVIKARVSCSWHPSTEVAEDWLTERTPYAGTLDDVPLEPVPLTVASGVADSAEWAGRANAGYAAAHSLALRRRQWSPMINETYRAPVELAGDVTKGLAKRYRLAAPGSATYTMGLFWLRWVDVPPGATHAKVRVHVQSWVASGAAVPLGVRCYAINRPPTVPALAGAEPPPPGLDYAFAGAVLTADHTSTGVGEWLDLGVVRLPRYSGPHPGWSDTVHLCLAYAFDPAAASANDAAAKAKINAWTVQPVEVWTPGGLFGG